MPPLSSLSLVAVSGWRWTWLQRLLLVLALVLLTWGALRLRQNQMVLWAYGLCLLLSAAYLATLVLGLRQPPLHLRWDGQVWHLRQARDGCPAVRVRLLVWADAGDFLVLRILPLRPRNLARRAHLPSCLILEREALDLDWHLLRSTVYCAQQASHGLPLYS